MRRGEGKVQGEGIMPAAARASYPRMWGETPPRQPPGRRRYGQLWFAPFTFCLLLVDNSEPEDLIHI
jgi:hypothetical protein